MAQQQRTRMQSRTERAPQGGRRDGSAVAERRTTSTWRQYVAGFGGGLLAGEAVLLLLSNLGSLAANAAFGPSGGQNIDGGVVGVSTLVAVLFGGWLAARIVGRVGLYMGIAVAIGFIFWGAIFQFLQEAQIVASSISAGGHKLVDLGPMDMGSLVMGDLLALFGGSVGGLLSGRR
ncbi:MAG: hypothetical protein JOY68_07995 [Candidatus Dormibacteraeota bacterium]|nr:hypothetical protein [Candidatus Dormibacteraeota bacterium]